MLEEIKHMVMYLKDGEIHILLNMFKNMADIVHF